MSMPQPAINWRGEFLRALAIVIVASLLGLGVNAFSAKPIAVLDPKGPGALPEKAPRIGVAEFKALREANAAMLLLDVRNPETVAGGAPEDSIHVPAHDFTAQYESLGLQGQLKGAEHIVVMCDSADCPAGDRVAKMLKDLRHENVRVFQGGWVEYRAAGLPLKSAQPEAKR
jgi:rhodanese-related sulfurtransferase